MFRGIDHVELVISPDEFEKNLDFFREVLGFKVDSRQKETPSDSPIQEIVFLELDGSLLELMSVEGSSEKSLERFQQGYRAIAIEVDDMAESRDTLEEKGIEITWGPKELDGSVRAEITTPSGLPIELREWE